MNTDLDEGARATSSSVDEDEDIRRARITLIVACVCGFPWLATIGSAGLIYHHSGLLWSALVWALAQLNYLFSIPAVSRGRIQLGVLIYTTVAYPTVLFSGLLTPELTPPYLLACLIPFTLCLPLLHGRSSAIAMSLGLCTAAVLSVTGFLLDWKSGLQGAFVAWVNSAGSLLCLICVGGNVVLIRHAFEVRGRRLEAAHTELQAERDLLERRVDERTRELALAAQAAEAAARAKSTFLATMSHEIRTPMNAVIGMAGLLDDTRLDEEQRDYAHIIRSSGEHLLTVINDILDFSKLESGKLAIENLPFPLRETVEEALDVIAVRTREKGVELAFECLGEVPAMIEADAGRVRQVLLNYLSNAAKFTAEGEIVVSLAARALPGKQYEIHLAVRDTGPGIAAEHMDRLFKSFSQVDASDTRKFGGTGLGLAICLRLAEMMGGRAWAESTPGQGSIFHFTFAAGASEATPPSTIPEPNSLQGLHAWVVDDNDTNRRILRRQCESWGMSVRDTASPAEALGWAERKEVCDLAILDFHMPEMDGVSLARKLQALHRSPFRGVLLSSGAGHLPQTEALALGLQAQLVKPVKSSQLFNTLLRTFGRKTIVPTAAAAPQADALDESMAARHPLRILVADDAAVNQKLISILLGRMGYRVDMAGNGREAIEALARQPYDVILMDVQMPEMDGIEATQRICADHDPATRPRLVALTAGVLPEERQACLDAGMDDFLRKPVERSELIAALMRCGRIPERSSTSAA